MDASGRPSTRAGSAPEIRSHEAFAPMQKRHGTPSLQITLLLFTSFVLFAVACCLPALEFQNSDKPNDVMYGLRALAVGWSGIFAGVVAWYANPCWFLSLLLGFCRRPILAAAAGAVSLLLATTTFGLIGRDLPADEGNVTRTKVIRLLPGYYLWLGSMALLPLAAAMRRQPYVPRQTAAEAVPPRITPPPGPLQVQTAKTLHTMSPPDLKASPQPLLESSGPNGATWLLHFRDTRPPHKIQFALERTLMALLRPSIEQGKLVSRTKAKIAGAQYSFLLRYEASLPGDNCYSLCVEVSWVDLPPRPDDYYRKISASWIDLWTRNFRRASPPSDSEGSMERYREICRTALDSEIELTSIEAIQQAIVNGMKSGASFATAHKEGGTNIRWHQGQFIASDYGESDESKGFSSEAEFLQYLRKFYDWETSRNVYPNKVSDFDAWKLILRLLRTP